MSRKSLVIILCVTMVVLLIPLIAMQFTHLVNWSGNDFAIMGILVLVTGLVIDFLARKVKAANLRVVLIIGVILLFLLFWAERAVGVIGTPFGGS